MSLTKPATASAQTEPTMALPASDMASLLAAHSADATNGLVINATNIRGAKGEHVNSFIRTQFADFDYKDTVTIMDNGNPEYNLSYEHTFNVDEALIETFSNKLLTLNLIESLPKEKTALLGTAELSLDKPFIHYAGRELEKETPVSLPTLVFRETVPIIYSNAKLLVSLPEFQRTAPECVVEVLLSRPLLSHNDFINGNFVNLHIDSVYPVPDEWNVKESSEKDLNSNIFTYCINLTLPNEIGGERVVSILNGSLVACETPPLIDPYNNTPHTITLTDTRKEQGIMESTGQTTSSTVLQTITDTEHNTIKPKETKRVSWASSVVVYIGPIALDRIRQKAIEKRPLELEFTRTLMTKFTSVVDTFASKYHGKANIDVSMLMYPNIIGIKGRFPLDAVNSNESIAQTSNLLSEPHMLQKGVKDTSNLYHNINSAISMELILSAPLIDKKKLKAITKSVGDFIPKRYIPETLLFEKRSKQAKDDYRTKINEIVYILVKEYRETLRMEANLQAKDSDVSSVREEKDEQQRKKLFMYHLTKSGAYFRFKEELKSSVVQIIRERFLRKSPFASKAEQQLFMSEAYVYLMDQMHVSIDKIFTKKQEKYIDPTIDFQKDLCTLKEYADAAEKNGQLQISTKYHLERVAKYDDTITTWFDYGCFTMRNNHPDKGEECFREILSRHAKHVPTLLVYGAICCMRERMEEAHVCISDAVKLEPECILANIFMGILLDILGEDSEAEIYIEKTRVLHQQQVGMDGPSHYLEAAKFAVNAHLSDFADRALSQELLVHAPSVQPHILLSHLKIQQGQYSKALDHLKDALNMDSSHVSTWAELGHLHYIQNKFTEAKHAYDTALSLNYDEKEVVLIFIRLGSIYLRNAYQETLPLSDSHIVTISHLQFLKHREESVDIGLALIAKNMFLKATCIAPSSQSWLGAGKACFALKEYQEAEDAFAEANVLNNRDSEVWAYLALLSLTLGRTIEAHQSIAQALRLGIKDSDILKAVGVAFLNEKQSVAAVECLRMALEENPDDMGTRELFSQALEESNQTTLHTICNGGNSSSSIGNSAKGSHEEATSNRSSILEKGDAGEMQSTMAR
ncbi:hypothetical protein BASA50_005685 [Batrachochytrium salamandrivorans]|uniref:Uncharacterized protein n=1 Tax=Batrachochytrium salamandrivorans TaxID=1357716 RepID=A0ABQ8FBY7_9FUNG|nr:hypothetical protein BASA62_003546 [Batrachochytrium salamandrivorans]KAH6594324.1 hypothetical protein BASA61_004047 [Batrachochytrium salamandrivorans]KAH6595604.1 hypothetical protein BASA50_005685 [Batrachochytrium salamandrivorans]